MATKTAWTIVLGRLLRAIPSILVCSFAVAGCAVSNLGAITAHHSALVVASGDASFAARSDEIFVVLAFSGGGTRSASFAYGLLEALRDTNILIEGRPRRLLDEVDVITSVSGGSYTAAYYGLFGDRIFDDFERRFLKRDIEGQLKGLLVNPVALLQLAAPDVGRSDIAAAWIDENIFDGRKFQDMRWPRGPFVVINASDINTGTTFSFIQQQFDFLCSTVADVPVARAVMASAAVPGYFTPIAVQNRPGTCETRRNSWIQRALAKPNTYSRDYHVARALERYAHPERMPVVRLVDGGMTDNLGVRGSMMSPVMHYGNVEEMSGAFEQAGLDKVSKVLVIIANAQVYEDYAWSRQGRDPSLIESLSASFDAAIGVLNSETISLARSGFEAWASKVSARKTRRGKPPVDLSFVTLTFDSIRDDRRRAYFNSLPMSLSLPGRQVDDLRRLARELLSQDAVFQKFTRSLK